MVRYILLSWDGNVSYYPYIILNLGLAPQHLGEQFLNVYRTIVDRRIEAKRAGNKSVADSLKIVVNGTFGKLGNMYSIIYSPDLLFQVTLTGQLTLLLLIERLELAGIRVVSANTDGIVIKCPRPLKAMDQRLLRIRIRYSFEPDSGFGALFSRDVNNYIAIKKDGKIKSKGAYAKPEYAAERLHKNPTAQVCLSCNIGSLVVVVSVGTIRACTGITEIWLALRTQSGAGPRSSPQRLWICQLGYPDWYYATGGRRISLRHNWQSCAKIQRGTGANGAPLGHSAYRFIGYSWYINE